MAGYAWWAAIALYVAWYIAMVPPVNRPLPSFRVLTGEVREELEAIYPLDFYPNGGFAHLPFGETRYYLIGPEKGRRIALVHGIGPPSVTFNQLARKLAKNGFRVLLYDLFGRGYSESPGTIHDEHLYVSQLALLLHHVGWTRCTVLGYSLGGAISTAFTSFFEDKVDALILVAPAGLLEELPMIGRVFSLPLLGETMVRSGLAGFLLKKGAERNFRHKIDRNTVNLTHPASEMTGNDEKDKFRDLVNILDMTFFQIDHHPGFQRSFLSTVRNFPMTRTSRIFNAFSQLGKHTRDTLPMLVVWGTNDTLIPFHRWKVLKKVIPHAQLSEVPFGGHSIVSENATAVFKAIQGFFKSL